MRRSTDPELKRLLDNSDEVFLSTSKAMRSSETTNEQFASIDDSLRQVIDDCSDVIRHLHDKSRKGASKREP